MAIPKKIIFFGVLFAIVYMWLSTQIGIGGGLVGSLAFSLAVAAIAQGLIGLQIFPFAFPKQLLLIGGVVLLLVGYTTWGWMAGWIPGAVGPGAVPSGPCDVTDELRGKASTLDVNAWDMESDTPYSAAVDLTTSCQYYKNGAAAVNYIGPSADTAAEELSGFTVGDRVYYYCGGASYYTDPILGKCITTQREPLTLETHAAVAESNMQIVVYDDTGNTALDAAQSTEFGDYNLTMGAGEEKSIHVKLKNNVADKTYNFCGWAVAKFYNVSKVTPLGAYTPAVSPLHLDSIDIEINGTTNTLNSDYLFFKTSPNLMREWDSIKVQFEVESKSGMDPLDQQGATIAGVNGFAILSKDCQYARGDDGTMTEDFYAHTSAQADVGVAETETSPRGKQTGVQVLLL